jgi:aldose 1-epimerase
MRKIRLSAGTLEAILLPEIGGSVARFDIRKADERISIFRPAPKHCRNVLQMGCFPIVPFANRIRGSSFAFRGRTITLSPNMPSEAFALHGQGWLAPWVVRIAEAGRAVLEFEHRPGEWPWHYRAQQSFDLDPGVLEIGLSCRNLSRDDMPCGLGLHPYFPCSPKTVLDAYATGVWTIDEAILPVNRIAPQGRYDLAQTLICGRNLDNGYDEWDGKATLFWPEHNMRAGIQAQTTRLQIYAPAEGHVVVVEPVTNANAALNAAESAWPSLGINVLKPSEEMQVTVRFEVHAPDLVPSDGNS